MAIYSRNGCSVLTVCAGDDGHTTMYRLNVLKSTRWEIEKSISSLVLFLRRAFVLGAQQNTIWKWAEGTGGRVCVCGTTDRTTSTSVRTLQVQRIYILVCAVSNRTTLTNQPNIRTSTAVHTVHILLAMQWQSMERLWLDACASLIARLNGGC